VLLVLLPAPAPVAIAQSVLSMTTRSFSGPVAVAAVASAASVVAMIAVGDIAVASPWGLLTRSALLGTGAFVDDGVVGGGDVGLILGSAVALTVVLALVHVVVAERRDVTG
jgi:hypothetical protein